MKHGYYIQSRPDGRLLKIEGDSYSWAASLFAASRFVSKRYAEQYIIDSRINRRAVTIAKVESA